ncbi:MAG TPA: hypothetical protein VFO83_05865 [Aggregicoccus sp.]|nr:hypothetical protein [Aggregicoccus sp.]
MDLLLLLLLLTDTPPSSEERPHSTGDGFQGAANDDVDPEPREHHA